MGCPKALRDQLVPFFCEPFLGMHADIYSALHKFTDIDSSSLIVVIWRQSSLPGADQVDQGTACHSVDVSLR